MASDITVDADAFAITLDSLLSGVENHIDGGLKHVLTETCEYAKDDVQANSPRRYGGYAKGWRYKVKSVANGVSGEVGNATYPGLVHLLEKGHAKQGGGRTKAVRHVAPAAESASEFFALASENLVEEAVSQ